MDDSFCAGEVVGVDQAEDEAVRFMVENLPEEVTSDKVGEAGNEDVALFGHGVIF